MTSSQISARAAMLAVFGLALLNRAALVWLAPFDGLYGQDAYAYFFYARELFAHLTRLSVPPPFWWPPGYPLLLSASFLLGGANIFAAQMVTLVCGALVAPFAFALAYQAAPARKMVAGVVAGLICAMSGQLTQSSLVIMADAPALMWATLGAWLLLRYARARSVLALCIAAFAVGMAVWTRWQNLIFAGVWIFTLAVIEGRGKEPFATKSARLILAAGIFSLALLPQFWIRATTNAPLAGQSWLEGWSVGNFFARAFDNVDGHFEYALPPAIFYGQVVAHPAYLFVMLTPLLGLGLFALWERRNSLLHGFILLTGWIVGMLIFLMGIPYENFRFPLALLSPLAVVTAIGAAWVWQRWRARAVRGALSAWIGLALLVMVYWQPRVLAPVWESKARQLAHARFLETHILPNALLYTMSIDGAVQYYTSLRVENLWKMEPAKLNTVVPTYLYVDTHNLESQWRGKLPDQLVRGLSETNWLHPAGSFDGWTLYRVRE